MGGIVSGACRKLYYILTILYGIEKYLLTGLTYVYTCHEPLCYIEYIYIWGKAADQKHSEVQDSTRHTHNLGTKLIQQATGHHT